MVAACARFWPLISSIQKTKRSKNENCTVCGERSRVHLVLIVRMVRIRCFEEIEFDIVLLTFNDPFLEGDACTSA